MGDGCRRLTCRFSFSIDVLEKGTFEKSSSARAACFYLAAKKLNGVDMATAFGRALPSIYKLSATYGRPLQVRVNKYGDTTVLEGDPKPALDGI